MDLRTPQSWTAATLIGLLAGAFALVVAGVTAFGLWAAHAGTLANTRAQATAIATFSAAYTARLYDLADRVILDARNHPEADIGAWTDRLARDARSTSLDDYYLIFDGEGVPIASSEPLRPGRIHPEFLDAHLQGADRNIGRVIRSPLTGSIIYPLSRAQRGPDGRLIRVFGASVRPLGVRSVRERGPGDPHVSIWTTDGRFIAATFVDFDEAGRSISPPRPPRLGQLLPGVVHEQNRHIYAQARVDGWPLIAVVEFDEAGVLSRWRQLAWGGGATAFILIAAGLGVGGLALNVAVRQQRAADALAAEALAVTRAAEAKDHLMREAHHRVRNSLMLASSFVQLQARHASADVRDALDRLQARIVSIGLVHQALYTSDAQDLVELDAYLRTLAHELWNSLGLEETRIELAVDLSPVRIAANKATPIGLLVSEAVTNAAKYAFPEGGGRILLKASQAGDTVTVSVIDDGVGIQAQDPDRSTGLGSKLFQALAKQIDGRASVVNENGTEVRVSFPAGA